jgi:hypothetical protein
MYTCISCDIGNGTAAVADRLRMGMPEVLAPGSFFLYLGVMRTLGSR